MNLAGEFWGTLNDAGDVLSPASLAVFLLRVSGRMDFYSKMAQGDMIHPTSKAERERERGD